MEQQDTPDKPSTLGRPRLMQDGKRITLTLDAETISKAKLLGEGNVSLGVRKALLQIGSGLEDKTVDNHNA